MTKQFLPLSLTGTCMAMPEEGIHELRFDKVKVRQEDVKSIEVKNPTKHPWVLQPTIHNSYWSGDKRFEVPANGSAKYDVRFYPLTMTLADGEEVEGDGGPALAASHHGSVFFALPNGSALMYRLVGTVAPPDPEGTIEKTVAAKKNLSIPLPVTNCFRVAQRMQVSIERLDGTDDHFYKGARSIDVPGSSTRDYKLNFIGYLEGKSEVKVTFTNSATGEYLYYFVKATCGPPESQGSFALSTAVRQSTSTILRIENPFYGTQKQVVFETPEDKEKANDVTPSMSWWSCDNPFVRVVPLNDFNENREGTFEVEYRPLIESQEQECNVVLKSAELGEYPFTFLLKAVPSQVERSLQFRCSLGSSHEQVFRITNFCGKATDYSCRVSQPLFFDVAPSVKADPALSWNGSELAISVKFEPQGLGEIKDVLTVLSPDGGEYTCTLYGVCDPPRPSGPFAINDPGKGINIDFKNVFEQAKEFKFIVDSDDFSVNGSKSQVMKVEGGKSVSLNVKSTATRSTTGKLLATCVDEPNLPAWTFYIKTT